MNVFIDSAASVTVDGVKKGHVLDAVRNESSLAADIKAAFDQFWIGQQTVATDAQNAANAQIATAAAANTATVNELQAKLDDLGGLPAVIEQRRLKRVADARVMKANAEAILAADAGGH